MNKIQTKSAVIAGVATVIVVVVFYAILNYSAQITEAEHQQMCQAWFDKSNTKAAGLMERSKSLGGTLDFGGELAAERAEMEQEYNRFTAECGDSGDYVR